MSGLYACLCICSRCRLYTNDILYLRYIPFSNSLFKMNSVLWSPCHKRSNKFLLSPTASLHPPRAFWMLRAFCFCEQHSAEDFWACLFAHMYRCIFKAGAWSGIVRSRHVMMILSHTDPNRKRPLQGGCTKWEPRRGGKCFSSQPHQQKTWWNFSKGIILLGEKWYLSHCCFNLRCFNYE
jgi:hypothetical protein